MATGAPPACRALEGARLRRRNTRRDRNAGPTAFMPDTGEPGQLRAGGRSVAGLPLWRKAPVCRYRSSSSGAGTRSAAPLAAGCRDKAGAASLFQREALQLGAIAQVGQGFAKRVGGGRRWGAAGRALERGAPASDGSGGGEFGLGVG